MNDIKPDNKPPEVKTIADLKDFILKNQYGLKKNYNNKDLYRFAIDERAFIKEGHDVGQDYMSMLPMILNSNQKLQIFKKDLPETDSFEMAISCFIFSGQQIQLILDFLDSFNQPVVEFTKFKKTGA